MPIESGTFSKASFKVKCLLFFLGKINGLEYKSFLIPIIINRCLFWGTLKSKEFKICQVKVYPRFSKILIIVLNVLPLSWFNKPLTFSARNDFGFSDSTILAKL